MEHRCELCGQELPHDGPDISSAEGDEGREGVVLGSPDEPAQPQPFARPSAQRSSGKDKRLLLGLCVAVVAWAAFVGVGRLTSPDESIDEQAAADLEERATRSAGEATEEQEPAAAETPLGAGADDPALDRDRSLDALDAAARAADAFAAADAAPGFPVVTPESVRFDDLGGVGRSQRDAFINGASPEGPAEISEDLATLTRELVERNSMAFVAYRSASGLVVIDLLRATAQEIEVASRPATFVPGAHLLRSGGSVFAIDPVTLDVSRVGSGAVVAVSRDGATYVVNPLEALATTATVLVENAGIDISLETAIEGRHFVAVDGLGLLLAPDGRTGETLIVQPEGIVPMWPTPVVAGSGAAVLEQNCSLPQCTLELVDLNARGRVVLPESFVRFGDRYSVAPDGGAVVRSSAQGSAEVLMVGGSAEGDADGTVVALVARSGMRHAAWDPDSGFVMWMDDNGTPQLKVMLLDSQIRLSIDLSDFGAMPPASFELVAFAFDPDS